MFLGGYSVNFQVSETGKHDFSKHIFPVLIILLHIVPALSITPTLSTDRHICIQSDNWGQYGLEEHGNFDMYLRPKLALFQTEHYSRLKDLEEIHQCKLCYTISKTNDVDYSRRDILEQGCLLPPQECDRNSCNNSDEDARSLRNDAFHVTMTLSSDDTNYPSLERKIPNTLNVSKDNFVGREEFEESLRLDFCCYVDPLNNCNSFVSGNRQSSNQKCITNLDISNPEETNGKIYSFRNPNTKLDQYHALHYVLIVLAFLIIMVVSILFLVRYFKLHQMLFVDRKHDLQTADTTVEANLDLKSKKDFLAPPSSSSVSFTPDNLIAPSSMAMPTDFSELQIGTLLEERRQECSVFQGTLGSKPVLVKSYPLSKKQNYFNEREVYELMNQGQRKEFVKDFLAYYGSGENLESNEGTVLTNFVVLQATENGHLSDFLERATVSWSELCKMLSSISQGLSYLHGFNRTTEPNLCHRNINGGNILVKRDLSCCLCNFDNVAVTTTSGQPFLLANYSSTNDGYLVHIENETTERNDVANEIVGSPRYLAPEVLDRALDMNQARGELSLKQIDVYAMGLIFWEISRRCRDLYQGVSVPNYEMAFYQELGPQRTNPTLEQMQILVSRYKARPLFPEIWKNSNPAIQRLRETIEDSWDQDGEARLTAFCIVERVQELNILWVRYKKGSTLHNHVGVTTNRTNILPNNQNTQTISNEEAAVNSEAPATIIRPHNFHNNRLNINREKNSIDLEKSISNKIVLGGNRTKNNNLFSRQQTIAQIQPHQGRNPCLERNIVSERSQIGDESCPLLLIYGSAKDTPIQTGPRTDAYNRFDYEDTTDDPELEMFSMGRQRQMTPQPIQLNIQNDFGTRHGNVATTINEMEATNNEGGLSKLNSLWKKKKKRGPKEAVHVTVSKRKPDINQEWEKEYQAAAQVPLQEDDEVMDELE